MHILLIGFMCCGKSSVGRELAPVLGMPFRDLDRAIEERVGPILPFFQSEGEEAFRSVEREVLEGLLDGPDAVIATGGGTPCERDNLDIMLAKGTVVWLDVPLDDLMPRIERAGGDRPLLHGLEGNALRARVCELLESRLPIYGKAEWIVQANAAVGVVADRIHAAVKGLHPR
ncbi:MAG: shikimate kinase [Flavobacteriales bacterium]|nr:shikimate kinase [Flavobacteriales bacterium]